MSVTAGSWWVNRRTGQRMAVGAISALLTNYIYDEAEVRKWGRAKWVRTGLGRSPDRVPCHLEGTGLFLAWLTEDEIRAAWRHYRPRPVEGVIPHWIRKSQFNDYLFYEKPIRELSEAAVKTGYSRHLSIQRIRSGWMCLTGMSTSTRIDVTYPKDQSHGNFNWGIQQYTTLFLPVAEAVPRMLPKYERIRKTRYDHIDEGGALGEG